MRWFTVLEIDTPWVYKRRAVPNRPLNHLLRDLPEGVVVPSAWLSERGISPQLVRKYVAGGWLYCVGPWRLYAPCCLTDRLAGGGAGSPAIGTTAHPCGWALGAEPSWSDPLPAAGRRVAHSSLEPWESADTSSGLGFGYFTFATVCLSSSTVVCARHCRRGVGTSVHACA